MAERAYNVRVYGYDTVQFVAKSRAAAMYRAFMQFRDAGSRRDFHWFIVNTRVWLARDV